MSGLGSLAIGASFTGVLAFGLQAAKFIAESVSSFQDTEEDSERFLGAIEKLARILTDVNELLQSYQDKLRYSSLYKVSKTCEDELIMIQQNILEWTESGKRSKAVRTWKEFKFLFMGDNLGRRLESLESHFGFITFQLNRIQLDDRKGQKTATEMVEPGLGTVSGTFSTVSDAQTNITEQIQINSTAVQDLSTSIDANFNQANGTLKSTDSPTKLSASTQSHEALEEHEHDESERAGAGIFQIDTVAIDVGGCVLQPEQMVEVFGDVGNVLDFAESGQFTELLREALEKDDPFKAAQGSICFDGVQQPLSAAVDEHCSCPHCYSDSEDEDIEILDKSSVDEFLVDDDQLWDSDVDTGLNCVVFPESPRKALSLYEPNCIQDDYEAFEELASNNGEPIYQPNHDASISNWARILEGWDYVDGE